MHIMDFFDKEISQKILKLESTDLKRFSAYQDKFGSDWWNFIPCKNLMMKMTNQQLRIAIGLQLNFKL